MIETWHSKFSPQQFLSRVNVDLLIEHNKAYNENKVEQLASPCILCHGLHGPGLILNDKTYLCKSCFTEVSGVRYPEKYEKLYRQYLTDREARNQARAAFIESCRYRKLSLWAGIATWILIPLLYFHIGFVIAPIATVFIWRCSRAKHERKVKQWESIYSIPIEPRLKHFHDPTADISSRDKVILKIFNNWPGYPPFWDYLREVVLKRDGSRCQVSGCPSRVELQIHHKIPVAQGGEHVPTNLVSLCNFHHALEPDVGHERIWGKIKTRYFTVVHAHRRRNSSSHGYHDVRAHVRRLELAEKSELQVIANYYGLVCSSCNSGNLDIDLDKQNQQVSVSCIECGEKWIGKRQLTEETGPRLSEALQITRNKGIWSPRWDMLEARADAIFRRHERSQLPPMEEGREYSPQPHLPFRGGGDKVTFRQAAGNYLVKRNNKKLKLNHKNVESKDSDAPKCPKCGSTMCFRKPRKGDKWKTFWGCSKYRSDGCNGSRSIDAAEYISADHNESPPRQTAGYHQISPSPRLPPQEGGDVVTSQQAARNHLSDRDDNSAGEQNINQNERVWLSENKSVAIFANSKQTLGFDAYCPFCQKVYRDLLSYGQNVSKCPHCEKAHAVNIVW